MILLCIGLARPHSTNLTHKWYSKYKYLRGCRRLGQRRGGGESLGWGLGELRVSSSELWFELEAYLGLGDDGGDDDGNGVDDGDDDNGAGVRAATLMQMMSLRIMVAVGMVLVLLGSDAGVAHGHAEQADSCHRLLQCKHREGASASP